MPLTVSEIFGPTIQGEGPFAGSPAVFLRLANCNLYCSWCDTAYSWDWTGRLGTKYDRSAERRDMTYPEVEKALIQAGLGINDDRRLVITGGEPLLQQAFINDFLRGHIYHVPHDMIEVETNGTIAPTELETWPLHYNVSPKLANSGVKQAHREKPDVIAYFRDRTEAIFKFVTCTKADLQEIFHWAIQHDVPDSRIWVMPEATTRAGLQERTEALIEATEKAGFHFTSRLHIAAWDGERGH